MADSEEPRQRRTRSKVRLESEPDVPSRAKILLPQVQCGPLLNAWSQAGKDFSHVYRALKDISRLQVLFAKETADILRRPELRNLSDATGVLVESWKMLFDLIHNSVGEQKTMGEYIQEDLLPNMERIMKDDLKAHRDSQANYRASAALVSDAAKNVKTNKQKCEKYDERAKNYSKDPVAVVNEQPKNLMGWGKKLFKDLKHKGETPEDMAKRAYARSKKAEEEYKEAVIKANDAQRNFRKETTELKTVVHAHLMRRAMQEIQFMVGVSTCYREHLEKKKLRESLEHFEEQAKSLSGVDIVTETYQLIIESHGVDPDVHTEFRMDYSGWRNPFFSLQDAYDAHETGAAYPKMLEVLCEKTKSLGGLSSEGIFRLSAAKHEIDHLKKYITQTKQLSTSSLDCTDCNVTACLLKDWLRGMDDALIPASHYDWCIDTVKSGKLDIEAIDIFIKSQLNTVNRESIYYLLRFLREFLNDDVIAVTKMSLNNLSIVFGPTLVRCPSEDPQVLLQNAGYEKKFVELLITSATLPEEERPNG